MNINCEIKQKGKIDRLFGRAKKSPGSLPGILPFTFFN